MSRRLRTSPQAARSIEKITAQIRKRSRRKAALEYKEYLASLLDLIKTSPQIWPAMDDGDGGIVHKAVLRQLTILLYTYTEEEVVLEAVHDARSNWL
jgi:plasmid stabilization system protein ParE